LSESPSLAAMPKSPDVTSPLIAREMDFLNLGEGIQSKDSALSGRGTSNRTSQRRNHRHAKAASASIRGHLRLLVPLHAKVQSAAEHRLERAKRRQSRMEKRSGTKGKARGGRSSDHIGTSEAKESAGAVVSAL